VQSINNLGLHHQFLARGVATVENVLREGEAYLLANQLHRSRGVSRQMEAELATAHSEAEATTHVAVVTNQLSTASKVTQVSDIVAKLVAALTSAPAEEPTCRPLRLRAKKKKEVSRQIRDLLDRGLIEPAHSAWSSPVVLVRKKDRSWRFCVDYRKLNSVTIQDAYPFPCLMSLWTP